MTEARLTVNFTKLNPEAHIPTQGSPHAAGWDLRALEKTVIHKGKSTKILTGLALAIPHGWEGQIRSFKPWRQGINHAKWSGDDRF